VVWHDVECGAYAADLPVWRALAAEAGGPVLDVGAGTGRVALDLARQGHEVVAVDIDPVLLAELERRAAGLTVRTVAGDARELALDDRFALVIVPMQTLQILGGPEGRAGFLRAAHAHLRAGGRLAAAITGPLPTFDSDDALGLPLPDTAQHAGHAYFSQPLAVRRDAGGGTVIERRRTIVAPDGARHDAPDTVRLDPLDPATLAAEARDAGYDLLEPRQVAPTHEHVGSTVVVLRRP
jgi:SAM-dependent methyltransferase